MGEAAAQLLLESRKMSAHEGDGAKEIPDDAVAHHVGPVKAYRNRLAVTVNHHRYHVAGAQIDAQPQRRLAGGGRGYRAAAFAVSAKASVVRRAPCSSHTIRNASTSTQRTNEGARAGHPSPVGVVMVMVVQPSRRPAQRCTVHFDEDAGVDGVRHLVHVVDVAGVHRRGVSRLPDRAMASSTFATHHRQHRHHQFSNSKRMAGGRFHNSRRVCAGTCRSPRRFCPRRDRPSRG